MLRGPESRYADAEVAAAAWRVARDEALLASRAAVGHAQAGSQPGEVMAKAAFAEAVEVAAGATCLGPTSRRRREYAALFCCELVMCAAVARQNLARSQSYDGGGCGFSGSRTARVRAVGSPAAASLGAH